MGRKRFIINFSIGIILALILFSKWKESSSENYYYDSGKLLRTCSTNLLGIKKCKEFYVNGKLKSIFFMKKEKLEGKFLNYYDSGALKSSRIYKNNFEQDTQFHYFQDGTLKGYKPIKKGIVSGIGKEFYNNGHTKYIFQWEDGHQYFTKFIDSDSSEHFNVFPIVSLSKDSINQSDSIVIEIKVLDKNNLFPYFNRLCFAYTISNDSALIIDKTFDNMVYLEKGITKDSIIIQSSVNLYFYGKTGLLDIGSNYNFVELSPEVIEQKIMVMTQPAAPHLLKQK